MRTLKSPNVTMEELLALTPADVVKVYSGRPGCACGCRGNYRYASAAVVDGTAAKDAGCEIEAGEINDRQVKKVLNLVQKIAKEYPDKVMFGSTFAAVDDPDVMRTYTVYPR